MKYVLKVGYHSRFEGFDENDRRIRKLYKPGDEIDLTKEEASKFKERISPVGYVEDEESEVEVEVTVAKSKVADEPVDQPDETESEEVEEPEMVEPQVTNSTADILDARWSTVTTRVSQIEDMETLAALYHDEMSGSARPSVLQAIQDQIDGLSE